MTLLFASSPQRREGSKQAAKPVVLSPAVLGVEPDPGALVDVCVERSEGWRKAVSPSLLVSRTAHWDRRSKAGTALGPLGR